MALHKRFIADFEAKNPAEAGLPFSPDAAATYSVAR
jgi:hypothetical protein